MEDGIGPFGAALRAAPTPAQKVDPKLLNEGWRRHFKQKAEEGTIAVLLDVPSGEKIAAVRMPLTYMVRTGIVPDRLTGSVQKQIAQIQSGDPEKARKETIESYMQSPVEAEQEWNALLDFIWCECVVLPKFKPLIEANPDDEENPTFPVDSVDMMDKVYLYQWCQGVNESVEDFFRTTSEAMGVMGDVIGVPLPSE